jgi:hypothetical protein
MVEMGDGSAGRRLTELVRDGEAELVRLMLHEKEKKGDAQELHEWLITLRVAQFLAQWHGEPAEGIEKVDLTAEGGIDVRFHVGDHHFAVEHTPIESWDRQYECNETGELGRVEPPTEEELPARRSQRLDRAVQRKKRKLATWASRICAEAGNCTTVLVLEDECWKYTNAVLVADALAALYPDSTGLPDWILLIEPSRQQTVRGLDDNPNRATLFILKCGESIFCSSAGQGERPPQTHYGGPYEWNQGTSAWANKGVPVAGPQRTWR